MFNYKMQLSYLCKGKTLQGTGIWTSGLDLYEGT